MINDQITTPYTTRWRRRGRDGEHDRADAEHEQRGGNDVQARAEHRARGRNRRLASRHRASRTVPRALAATSTAAAPTARRPPNTGAAARRAAASTCTSRPDVSSSAAAPTWPAGRSATTVATRRNATPKYCRTKVPCTPKLSSVSLIDAGTAPVATLATMPNKNAAAATPAHHAQEHRELAPRRRARAATRGRTGGDARRRATRAHPRRRHAERRARSSRRPARPRSAPASSERPQSLSVNGRMRSVHPNGVTSSSQCVLGPESAIMRTTNATPNTSMPRPVATRRIGPAVR